MASTRNRNDKGNYALEQLQNQESITYNTYKNYGVANTNHFAGDGLIMGRMGNDTLAYNATDIESFLRGTGVTNLVGPSFTVQPEVKKIDSLAIMNKLPLIMPEPLKMENLQRPLPS